MSEVRVGDGSAGTRSRRRAILGLFNVPAMPWNARNGWRWSQRGADWTFAQRLGQRWFGPRRKI
jgi:hypothetical protein